MSYRHAYGIWVSAFACGFSAVAACSDSSKGASVLLPAELRKVTTRCVGRYLIDIPETFFLSSGSAGEFYFGTDTQFRKVDLSIPEIEGGQQAFELLVEARVKDLTSTYHFKSVTHNKLLAQNRIDNTSRFLRAYGDSRSTETFKSELYSRMGPATLLLSREVYSHENGNSIEASLIKIADGSKYVEPGNMAGRGTCLGPVLIEGGQDAEILSPSYQSSQYRDVRFKMYMNSIVSQGDGGLFARSDSKADLVSKLVSHSDTLRKDKITIGGWPAEEILETGKDRGKTMRSFTAETLLIKPSSFGQPLISIEMTMGGQVDDEYRDASLSDAEALALWDVIVKSIRLRPGAI